MQAICTLIRDRLSCTAVKRAIEQPVKRLVKSACTHINEYYIIFLQGKAYPLETYAAGLQSTHDATLDNAIRALRLLHIKHLRDLQTNINETIVAVQNLTANPKTDARLGKIGI